MVIKFTCSLLKIRVQIQPPLMCSIVVVYNNSYNCTDRLCWWYLFLLLMLSANLFYGLILSFLSSYVCMVDVFLGQYHRGYELFRMTNIFMHVSLRNFEIAFYLQGLFVVYGQGRIQGGGGLGGPDPPF